MKELPGYEIVVGKGGAKLTPAAPPTDKFPGYEFSRDANDVVHYTFTKTSMNLLTNRAQMMLRRTSDAPVLPVVDHTGLNGKFDFHLDVEAPLQSPSDPGDNATNISDAMQHQLGLKLNGIKIRLEVLVIDHVNREPAAN